MHTAIRTALVVVTLLQLQISLLYSQQEKYRTEQIPFTGELENFKGTCIIQDREGFMWFGSQNGLYRYDGSAFKVFQHDPFDQGSIPNDHILGLVEDRSNSLWVGTNWGLVRFDKLTEQFDRSPFVNDCLTSICEDRNGNILLGGYCGSLSKYDSESERMVEMISCDFSGETQENGFYGLLEDRSGSIWILTHDSRVYTLDPETRSLERLDNVPCGLAKIFEDRLGRLWFTSECGLYVYNVDAKTFEQRFYKPGDPNRMHSQLVADITEDQSGNLWIRTLEGIYKYSQGLELLYHWEEPVLYDLASVNRKMMINLFADNMGNIWFYDRNGITKLLREHNNFTVFNPDPPLSNINDWIYLVNDDSLLYGSWSESYYAYHRKKNLIAKYPMPSIHDVLEDSKGEFWIGTDAGLYRLSGSDTINPDYIRYQPIPGDRSSLPGMHVNYIFEDSYGKVWIACRGAPPCYYDRPGNCFIQLVDNPGASAHLTFDSQVRYETEQRELWVINSGVFKIIPPFIRVSDYEVMASDIIEYVAPNPVGGPVIANFYATHQDQRGTLWLGDKSLGLSKMTENPGQNPEIQLENYSIKDGLPSNSVFRIQEDQRGMLWLGTRMGLSKFDPHLKTFTNFNEQDGLPVNRFQNASAINSRGEIFMGTVQGMISFHPDSIRINTRVPPVRLTGFRINNQEIIPSDSSVLQESIQFTDEVSLAHNQNTLTLSFAALNFIQPELNQYKYMLVGIDQDWVYSGRQNTVTYAGLHHGNYIFRASGSNNKGIWNEEGVTLSIHILPPPWLTWWAYVGYILFLAGMGVIIWRYLVKRAHLHTAIETEKMEKQHIRELDQLKSRFFTNISHEFRTPLTLIAGPVNDLLRSDGLSKGPEKKLLNIVRRNTRRLHQLINQLLEISKLETGKMTLEVREGDLSGFIRSTALSYLSLAERNEIQYRVDVKHSSNLCYFDEDKIEKITCNLISNALKYTPGGGFVRVSLIYLPHPTKGHINQVKIVVSDSGPGISADERNKVFDRFYQVIRHEGHFTEGSGLGLALVKEIADLYRGEIKLESELGKGSTFTVTLPVSRDAFREDEITAKPSFTAKEPCIDKEFYPEEELEYPDGTELMEGTDADNPLILIVEDNADLRTYISFSLAKNFRIIEARNGAEGLEKAREDIPELVVTDLMMPVMDGLAMCHTLKNDEWTSHIPVIVLTAKADQATKLECFETGADTWLLKPFDSKELMVRVKSLIEQRSKLRKKFSRDFFLKTPYMELSATDERFLDKVSGIIKDHLDDADFSVESFSHLAGMSRSQLYRKLHGIAGLSPSQFIRNLRLKHSLLLLEQDHANISQIAYEVGFSDHAYYSKCFRELYGISPSEYIPGKQAHLAGSL